FSTAWRIASDSLAASASVSIRNQVFPPGASQTYFMHPPTFHTMSGVANRRGQALHYQRRTTSRQGQVRVRIAYYSINFSRVLRNGEFFLRASGQGSVSRSGPLWPTRGRRVACRMGVGPFSPQRDQRGHDRWAEKQPQNPEGFQSAEDT